MGFAIEIDDFGTGESSLSMLTELPADVLKLDRSLVAKVDTSPRSAAVVRAVADMARALHLSLVAEGVETKEQAEKSTPLDAASYRASTTAAPRRKKNS